MGVYDLCEAYAPKRVGLTLRLLDDDVDDPGSPSVLIEGSSGALRLLAHLILAVAERDGDDGFEIPPHGPGSIHSSSAATLGVYIHRLDE